MENRYVNICLIAIFSLSISACISFTGNKKTNHPSETAQRLMNATARLGVQLNTGGEIYDMCSATAIARNKKTYEFKTAGHCATVLDDETMETIPLTSLFPIHFTLTFEAVGNDEPKTVRAELKAYGDRSKFEDWAILEAELNEDIALPRLYKGNKPVSIREELGVVVAPLPGMGNLYLVAYASKPKINAKYMFGNIDLQGAIPIQVIGLGVGQGSSGSAVVSIEKDAIIGTISISSKNAQGHVTISLCPISKFHSFYADYKSGKTGMPKVEDASSVCQTPTEECLRLLKTSRMPIIGN